MDRVLSVTQLNEYVRRSLASDPMLKGIQLRGEISNLKLHSAGHLYFTLKDEEAKISCVMFRSAATGLMMRPRDGMRVVVMGSVALYAAAGQYQFYVDAMRDDGVGVLYAAFEKLKAKLMAEGLFDAGRKRPLPLLPRGIGIVTSPTGAVIHDIQQVAARRHPGMQLFLVPSAVQGDSAPADIMRGLAILERREDVDVIIVGRGGGSLEELWAFNDEGVARAIFACKKPVVSAVGHETDFTIADFVADVRAATPSNAAELAVPEFTNLNEILHTMMWRLSRAQTQRFELMRHRLDGMGVRLFAREPLRRAQELRHRIDSLKAMLTVQMESVLQSYSLKVEGLANKLEALSPKRVLTRGYAIATTDHQTLLTDAGQVTVGSRIRVTLRGGSLGATVTEVQYGDKEKSG